MRYRLHFSKTKAMRFTGNLDMHRTLTRAMRRANLPLAYSQGFNPRPKLTLASALPHGYTSEFEVADFWLKEPLTIPEIETALQNASSPGMQFHTVKQIEPQAAKLQVAIQESTFQAILLKNVANLDEKITDVLAKKEIILVTFRKGKRREKDLRAFLFELARLPDDEESRQRLIMRLQAGEGTTGRPDDVLKQLEIDPLDTRVHRTKIIFSSD
jgi:radical SAM-linked protein